ncbi:MAG: SIS domain-containing protein [Patescibacteria group bacterium]|nr:SIS domain-containing protein [Patescibacteria group bacterium]
MEKQNTATIDKNNLRQVIIDTPNQFIKGLEVAGNIGLQEKFDSIVVCGMGGSAMPGYLLKTIAKVRVPVFVHTSYGIPSSLTKNPLFFISSFSGNTEETIAAYDEAKKNYSVIGFSNGGKLAEKCQADDTPSVTYNVTDKFFQPRCALALAFSAMAKVAANSNLIDEVDVSLKNVASFLEQSIEAGLEKDGQAVAGKIKRRIPIFYASYESRYVAMINKIKVNENAKLPAFWNYYPELNHNEFNGYLNGAPDSFAVISLQDPKTHPQNIKRDQITNDLLTKMGYSVVCIKAKGISMFQRFFYLLTYGDWIAYYLAISINQDPTPVKMVEELKKKLT